MSQALATAALTLVLLLSACVRVPDGYPPPAQYVMPSGPEPAATPPGPVRPMLGMADLDWKSHVLADVMGGPDGEEWRWTNQHPRFRLILNDARDLRFHMRCIVAEDVFRKVGPLTVSIAINGRELDRPSLGYPGEHEYAHAIPPGWLAANQPNDIALDIDPVLIAPDGVKLGLLLHSIGFRK